MGVRMADGREFRSKAVISDAGARNTFERLVPAPNIVTDALVRLPQSMAHLSLYVGLKHTAAELGLSGTNLWVHPTPDHDANVERFASRFPRRRSRCFSSRSPQPRIRSSRRGTRDTPPSRWSRWSPTSRSNAGREPLAPPRARLRRLQGVAGGAAAGGARAACACRGRPHRPCRALHAAQHAPLHESCSRGGVWRGRDARTVSARECSSRGHTSPTSISPARMCRRCGVTGAMFGGALAASAVLGKNLISRMTKPRR